MAVRILKVTQPRDGFVHTYELVDVVEVRQTDIEANGRHVPRNHMVGSFFSQKEVIEYFQNCGYTTELEEEIK